MKVKVYHTNHEQEAVDMEFETLEDIFNYARHLREEEYNQSFLLSEQKQPLKKDDIKELIITTVSIWDKDENGNYLRDNKGFYTWTAYPAIEIYDDWRE